MAKGIHDDIPLDYIELQIFPSQNRYDSYIGKGSSSEMVKSETLEPLLLHLPAIKELHAKGYDAKYKLIAPAGASGARWFTKSTLLRFLHVIGSPEVLKGTDAIRNEISQLEDARKFHISLYAGNSSSGDAPNLKAGIGSSSDDSKNELLRAIDLRLTALRGDLAAAFAEVAGARFSNKEMDYLEKFSHHFGAAELRDSLCKLVELNQEKCPAEFQSPNPGNVSSGKSKISSNQETNQNMKPLLTEIPVKYSASPAKAAQVERESSSDCGESSCSSEGEQPSVERSRTMIRCASPRRSASPMRRVQIGRSGSRRSTALTIKSLTHFPRERLFSTRDAGAHDSDEESSEHLPTSAEVNVTRMSVQDAISLFERKQKDQTGESQIKSSTCAAVGTNKAVLRRWSSSAGEKFSQDPVSVEEDHSVSLPSNKLESADLKTGSSEAKTDSDLSSSEDDQALPTEVAQRSGSSEQKSLSPHSFQEENAVPIQTETSRELIDSAEWSRQKEAELNQLFMKMMETKPVKYQTKVSDNRKRQSLPGEQKGGFYDQYKEKRNEKLRKETNGKREEKEKQFRAMQQAIDQRKSEMASANGSEAGRKLNVKGQKPQKTSLQPANQKKDISKPSVVKKASTPLPVTRKSWPSTPSPRPAGTSPAKTPPGVSSAGARPTQRKPLPASSVPRSSPKLERPEPKPKPTKSTQINIKKGVKDVNEKKQQLSKKPTKPTKPKGQSVNVDSATLPKPRATKKSSVVPVESKPFLRKGSRIGSGVGPASRTKASLPPEEAKTDRGDLKKAEENEIVSSTSDHVNELEMNLEPLSNQPDDESNSQTSQHQAEHVEVIDKVTNMASFPSEPALSVEDAEESMISPTAWVETEEQEELPAPCSDNVYENESPRAAAPPVGMPSPRVRHSLSQMLLEESSEPEVIEWGNAENPPALVYQKDEPKGLKRLLKFARKSKTDANSSGWSSPSVFSEGEDDADESKVMSRRSSENLLKKATLHSAAHGTFAQANLGKATAHRLSEKLQEGQSLNTTKVCGLVLLNLVPRGFFYLPSGHDLELLIASNNARALLTAYSGQCRLIDEMGFPSGAEI
ncbi:OLC1v1027054C1 [Oldenlandia corymbosa var. corymbosa]|uniref:OLC1v1027054C1 n=1 Tax=Oldenlandia corymbosa var. corymbosa TaxID=529605 RepID=A0AAV1CBL0_OLDCO|nr:OLC1v1027054C1 [Oldenlandia corymbosa var. corymbosa]